METQQIYRVKFSTRGRVTIPAALRKELAFKPGSRVSVEIGRAGEILLRPRSKR